MDNVNKSTESCECHTYCFCYNNNVFQHPNNCHGTVMSTTTFINNYINGII